MMLCDDHIEPRTSRPQFSSGKLSGAGGGAIDQICDADATLDEVGPVLVSHRFASVKITIEDAGEPQCRVETVPGMGEVSLRGRGPQARVDADEEQLQSRAD